VNPHTPIAEAANIQYLNCLAYVQPAKCWTFPCQTFSKVGSSSWWLTALTMVASTVRRWLLVSLLPWIFQHHYSI